MSHTDFLPRREADLCNWSAVFNAKINADPVAFGLTPALALEYKTKHMAFAAALEAALNPATRTSPQVQTKNAAMKMLRQAARQLVRIIQNYPALTNAQRIDLSLTVERPGGRQMPLPRPHHAPVVIAQSVPRGRVQLRLRSKIEPSSKARPRGVASALVMMYVGEQPPLERERWSFCCNTSKTKVVVSLPPTVQPGESVWFVAGWENPRSQIGPLSMPVRVRRQHDLSFGAMKMRKAA